MLVPHIDHAASLLGQARGPIHVRIAKERETSRHALLGECFRKDVVDLHCFGIFAVSTARLQRFDSLMKNSRSCSGVLARGSTPSSPKRFCTSGAASAFASSSCTRLITAGGVFAGAASAFHETTSYPLTPASITVGTS